MKKEYETPNMEMILLEGCVITSSGDETDNWEEW